MWKFIINFLLFFTNYYIARADETIIHNLLRHQFEKDLTSDPFHELDPEESTKRFFVLVKKMDKNFDNLINKEELVSWIVELLKQKDIVIAEKQLKELDNNRDNNISWEELIKFTHGLEKTEIDKLMKSKRQGDTNLLQRLDFERKKFTLADNDLNGMLNATEYKLFLFPEHYEQMAPLEIVQTLQDFDLNKDGKIDFQEFLAGDSLNNETLQLEQQHFREYDLNSDGSLSGSEITKLSIPGFEHISQGEAAHLINETDENKDGMLSFDEIIKMQGLWIGSQVTNFGDMLYGTFKAEL